MPEPFVLPPLPRRESRGNSWEQRLDAVLARAVAAPSWPRAILYWIVRLLAKLTLRFGRTFPYVYRPWYWLSRDVRRRLDQQRHETVRTVFLRRLFGLDWPDKRFRISFALVNWLTVILCLPLVDDLLDGLYAYATYPFGTYHDVVVTQAYRNITENNTYSVHGYTMVNGEKREYYFELRPNIWFWQFYVEFQFGQIPVLGRCTFDTYGITLRIPKSLRLFAPGSLYALNPYIVNMDCTPPTIVPEHS